MRRSPPKSPIFKISSSFRKIADDRYFYSMQKNKKGAVAFRRHRKEKEDTIVPFMFGMQIAVVASIEKHMAVGNPNRLIVLFESGNGKDVSTYFTYPFKSYCYYF